MASEEAEKKQEEQQGASYTYWVRQVKEGDAAPLPVPRKLTPDDIINDSNSQPPTLGSLWNKVPFFSSSFIDVKNGIFDSIQINVFFFF